MEDLKDWELVKVDKQGARWNGNPIELAYGILFYMKNEKTNEFKYWDIRDERFLNDEEEKKVIGTL